MLSAGYILAVVTIALISLGIGATAGNSLVQSGDLLSFTNNRAISPAPPAAGDYEVAVRFLI